MRYFTTACLCVLVIAISTSANGQDRRPVRPQSNPKNDVLEVCALKYEDLNGNGVRDRGEPTLQGWEINAFYQLVDRTARKLESDITDSRGIVCMRLPRPEIRRSSLWITETNRPGWVVSTPKEGHKIDFQSVGDSSTVWVEFGNIRESQTTDPERVGELCLVKFFDRNANGRKDEGERILDGWEFTATNSSSSIGLNPANREGVSCTRLEAGRWTITETLLPNWAQTTPSTTGRFDVVIQTGGKTEMLVGNTRSDRPVTPQSATVCLEKFEDVNGNGYKDNEPSLGGWEFRIRDSAGKNQVGTTDREGRLCFNGVAPGQYVIGETPQSGWIQTAPAGDGVIRGTASPGGHHATHYFGNRIVSRSETQGSWSDQGAIHNEYLDEYYAVGGDLGKWKSNLIQRATKNGLSAREAAEAFDRAIAFVEDFGFSPDGSKSEAQTQADVLSYLRTWADRSPEQRELPLALIEAINVGLSSHRTEDVIEALEKVGSSTRPEIRAAIESGKSVLLASTAYWIDHYGDSDLGHFYWGILADLATDVAVYGLSCIGTGGGCVTFTPLMVTAAGVASAYASALANQYWGIAPSPVTYWYPKEMLGAMHYEVESGVPSTGQVSGALTGTGMFGGAKVEQVSPDPNEVSSTIYVHAKDIGTDWIAWRHRITSANGMVLPWTDVQFYRQQVKPGNLFAKLTWSHVPGAHHYEVQYGSRDCWEKSIKSAVFYGNVIDFMDCVEGVVPHIGQNELNLNQPNGDHGRWFAWRVFAKDANDNIIFQPGSNSGSIPFPIAGGAGNKWVEYSWLNRPKNSHRSYQVNWNPIGSASHYKIYLSRSTDFSITTGYGDDLALIRDGIDDTVFVFEGLEPKTDYYYKVEAIGSNGTVVWSSPVKKFDSGPWGSGN